MRFGVRLSEGGQDFEQPLSQALLAEELGFDAVYLAEHHSYPGRAYWPTPFLGLAGVTSHTSTVEIGTNIAVLPFYNPVRLAENISMLDVMANGRTRFGFGIGWRNKEFETFDVSRSERGARSTEYARFLNAVYDDGPVTFDGEFVSVTDLEIVPEPVQSPRPPFQFGGLSEATIDRAINLGEGWVSPGGELDTILDFIDRYRDAGGESVTIGTDGVIVREKEYRALVDAERFLKNQKRPHIAAGNRNHIGAFEAYLDKQSETLPRDTEQQIDEYADRLVDFLTGGDIRTYVDERTFIAGTPSDCIDQIQDLRDQTGCEEIIFKVDSSRSPPADIQTTLELLGNEVLPSVRD